MKKLLSGLLLLAMTFAAAFYAGKLRQVPVDLAGPTPLFTPSLYPLINHPFAIVIVGRNNGAWVEKTLRSACQQNYANFRIVYIDDASDDGSSDLAQDLSQEAKVPVAFLRNEEPLGHALSVARGVALCEPQEIVVTLGGDDWLAHEWVLTRLNQYYANVDLWMTYGGARQYPNYALAPTRSVDPKIPVRQQPFFASQLHSFYADLFQRIAPEDLHHLQAGPQAYMIPMLEMAGAHSGAVSDVLYISNEMSLKEPRDYEPSVSSLRSYAALTKRHVEEGPFSSEEMW